MTQQEVLDQVWANYGARTGYGPFGILIEQAKHVENTLLIYISIMLLLIVLK